VVPLEYLERSVRRVNAERPDLVALTGDYVTLGKRKEFIEPVAAALGKLRAPLGVFASLGNHDVWVDGPLMQQALERHGCAVLRNRGTAVVRGGARLGVVGLGDQWTEEIDFARGFRGVPEGRPSLILMHNPDAFEDWPAGHPGLILAGHTHGGQVAIPGYGPPFVPSRYGNKYARGLFQRAGTAMYVNRGVGTAIIAVRFMVRPEIAILTLRPA
jgi:predicted MPP superfamily phosphohydrolase